MICNKRTASIDPLGKPVDCKSYISVGRTADGTRPVGFCSLSGEFLCIEDTDGRFPRLSFSAVNDFLECPRKYFLKHVKGIYTLPTATGDPLKMGVLWDQCLRVLVGNVDKSIIRETINKYEISDLCQAKVRAMYKAFKDLNIYIDPMCKAQDRFELTLPYGFSGQTYVLTGVYDRLYPDDGYFVESKFSRSPDFYFNIFNLTQIATYFASNADLKYAIVEVARCPDLRMKDASPEEYFDKAYADIMSRPAFYFPGWNKERRTFGKKFHRTEFNIDDILERYAAVYYSIADTAFRGAFYKNHKSCYGKPFNCDLIPICLFDTMSETEFGIKIKPVFTVPIDESTYEGQVAKQIEQAVEVSGNVKEIKAVA